jgi:hypothetical protein
MKDDRVRELQKKLDILYIAYYWDVHHKIADFIG